MPLRLNQRCYCLICLITFSGAALDAQVIYLSEKAFYEIKDYYDCSYGSDYNLLNGRRDNLLYSSISHPFFNSDQYRPGNIRLNGEDYRDITFNYDIFKQHVILQYPSLPGQPNKLVLNNELIDNFYLDGKSFRKMSFPITGTRYFQIVRSGEISCYLHWKKKGFQTTSTNNTSYKYSKQSREIYVQKEGQLHLISNRSSFIALFDKDSEEEIKYFIRREKIIFRNADDDSLGYLVDFCMSLTGSK